MLTREMFTRPLDDSIKVGDPIIWDASIDTSSYWLTIHRVTAIDPPWFKIDHPNYCDHFELIMYGGALLLLLPPLLLEAYYASL